MFKLSSRLSPAGDQPKAIEKIVQNFDNGVYDQVLLGVTGSGKTFTMANIITKLDMPALILAPNKTLAAQLFEEMKELFPYDAVEYFVSYYDYYQPEAYKPASNTYIPKESQRNQRIDQLRHKATRALCENKNVIVVASVSCLYGMGSVEAYKETVWRIFVGQGYDYDRWIIELNMLQYVESLERKRGTFFINKIGNGDIKDNDNVQFMLWPAHLENEVLCISIKNGMVHSIDHYKEDIMQDQFTSFNIYPNTHHIVQKETVDNAVELIEQELKQHLKTLKQLGKNDEAGRLEERTRRDITLLKSTLSCPGVENYSRYFTNRQEGQPPPTLYEFFPKPFLCIVDESHIMVPQIKAMSHADRKRKQTLIEYGFRLPSCLDNRPLTFEEWNKVRNKTLFVSATPASFEMNLGVSEIELSEGNNMLNLNKSKHIVEQVIRPTGLVDPVVHIRPTQTQLQDALEEARKTIEHGYRVIMLTLTKKMAEKLSEFLLSMDMKAEYIHADVKTLARIKILQNLRKGVIDIVVGINLLREGIDIPECGLVIIFDADQEGYLRSQTALIQMIGRAARNQHGRVICYADKVTKSMQAALDETNRRRQIQLDHNLQHNIIPVTTSKPISSAFDLLLMSPEAQQFFEIQSVKAREKFVDELEKLMKKAAQDRNFEEAIRLRDALKTIKGTGLGGAKGTKKIAQEQKEAEAVIDNTVDNMTEE